LKARVLIPIDSEVNPGAETVKFNVYDRRGIAKVIKSYADDLPRVDLVVTEVRSPIRSLGISYGFSQQELRAAAMAGMPLETQKATMARRAIEEAIDKIGAKGDSLNGLNGLLGIPNANTYTVPNGAGGTATWGGATPKTADEILADLNGIINTVRT